MLLRTTWTELKHNRVVWSLSHLTSHVCTYEDPHADVALVESLVDRYLESSRTIILAVVQANNDTANQSIIKRARMFDRTGQRTVGIITKADIINVGTKGRIALLANNEDTTKLKLGYFLLKNPSPSELEAGMTIDERKRTEVQRSLIEFVDLPSARLIQIWITF